LQEGKFPLNLPAWRSLKASREDGGEGGQERRGTGVLRRESKVKAKAVMV
jgi:hypothetical protein